MGLFGLLLSCAVACGKQEPADPGVAKVNGRVVTQAEVDALLAFKNVPKADEARAEQALDEYLKREGLADAIERAGLLDDKALQAELRDFRQQMLISRYFDKYLAEQVPEAAIRNYYASHASDYEHRQVHAAHILFRLNPKMSEQERQAKQTAALDAKAKLAAGADFAELAQAVSEDRVTGKRGGDLGWLKEGAIDAKFTEAVFPLEQGAVTEPFETRFGLHIAKVLEPAKKVKQPFEAVMGDIRYRLRAQAKEAERERLLGQVKVERLRSKETQQGPSKVAKKD